MKENLSNGQGFFYSIFQGNKLNNNDVQGILNYVKAMDGGAKHAEAFSANLTRCSVAAQKYIIDANNAGKSTEQISAGLKDAAKAGGGFKGVIINITSTLANMATGMIIGAAIQFVINTIITAFDNLVNAYKKSIDEMSNYQSNISSLKSETESLNKELKDTKEKIAAIESTNPAKMSDNKTFAEVYNSAEFSDVTKKLEELAKAGKLTEDTFNSVDGIDKFKEAIGETLTEGQTFADVITFIN